MNKETYTQIEQHMLSCMDDSAHDKEHVYRVLYNALEIAESEADVDYDILIAACLLHDIGRREQMNNPALCHAEAGAVKAWRFLTELGFDSAFAEAAAHCVRTHRFRKNDPPESIEAKILFDADKLDAAGAIGIARTLMYRADVPEPLYTLLPDGTICDGTQNAPPSFFQEYKFKLEKLYDRFYTKKGAELAAARRIIAAAFYESLYREVSHGYAAGRDSLAQILNKD